MGISGLIPRDKKIGILGKEYRMTEMAAAEVERFFCLMEKLGLFNEGIEGQEYSEGYPEQLMKQLICLLLPEYEVSLNGIDRTLAFKLIEIQDSLNGLDELIKKGDSSDKNSSLSWFDICFDLGRLFGVTPMEIWQKFTFRQINYCYSRYIENKVEQRAFLARLHGMELKKKQHQDSQIRESAIDVRNLDEENYYKVATRINSQMCHLK